MTIQEKIEQLSAELRGLSARHDSVSMEIQRLHREINKLKLLQVTETPEVSTPVPPVETIPASASVPLKTQSIYSKYLESKDPTLESTKQPVQKEINVSSGLEKFIGENLINKVGIAITIIGVAIGTKYSIDHELISPLTRIILGYCMGIGLLVFGIKLKKNYENYSAVLVSGALAIMYFITFAAYSFYDLFPQVAAFLLMALFTVFAVIAAVHYNRQVIAHIGLVGAYAVPFFLSDGSGRIAVVFIYMTIINSGILAIAYRKYWQSLYYSSFAITWLIYLTWFISAFDTDIHFNIALGFAFIFFITFYLIILLNKLVRREKYVESEIAVLFLNAFIFYGSGYAILDSRADSSQLLGLFTMTNAVIHFIVSVIIYRSKLADKNLFYFISGLVLVFITIAIPVQLDGNWVTLFWISEATLLFWIGRTRNVTFYEKLSYPLIVLAVISLLHDWFMHYESYRYYSTGESVIPFFNTTFLSSLIVIGCFAFINYINLKSADRSAKTILQGFIGIILPALLITIIYLTFRNEIASYWDKQYNSSSVEYFDYGTKAYRHNPDMHYFKQIWLLIYSSVFLSILAFINIKKLRYSILAIVTSLLTIIVIYVFLTSGLIVLGKLRDSYLDNNPPYYNHTFFNVIIRYLFFACIAVNFLLLRKYLQDKQLMPHKERWYPVFEIIFHIALLAVLCSELITWMNVFNIPKSDKLGLSILWGVYALSMIVLGIQKRKKYLRLAAIALFAATLIKLFMYDITHLDTIAKTIVFVSLGVLLLIISFLYNKYQKLITD